MKYFLKSTLPYSARYFHMTYVVKFIPICVSSIDLMAKLNSAIVYASLTHSVKSPTNVSLLKKY